MAENLGIDLAVGATYILSHFARLSHILTVVAEKTASKTAPLPKNGGARLPLGNHPGNTGGKKGRSGRHPDVWKQFLAKLRGDPKFHKAIKAAAHDSESRGFSSAIKLVTEYDEAKPAQRTDVTTGGRPISGVVVLPGTE